MNTPDLATYSAEELIALIAAANEQLQRRREEHIAAGQKLGLAFVDENGTHKRKQRNSKHHAEA
jgi:hypothetical protein